MRYLLWIILTIGAAFATVASAAPIAKELFGNINHPSTQASQSYGSYANGCLAGALQLPESGTNWQTMRLSRNRNWGHPDVVSFIERLASSAEKAGWSGLYIGDMSQPRGGPMLTGHTSHQIGLDVDIWMLPAERMNLTAAAAKISRLFQWLRVILSLPTPTGPKRTMRYLWPPFVTNP